MKLAFLVFFAFISFAAVTEDEFNSYRIRSIEALDDEGQVMVTFWEDNRVYRILKNSDIHHCLERAMERPEKVRLKLDKDEQSIEACRVIQREI